MMFSWSQGLRKVRPLVQMLLRRINWKVAGSTIWLLLTFSLTVWWFRFAMTLAKPTLDIVTIEKRERMIFWEGYSLLAAVFLGGLFLIWYTFVDSRRADRIRDFFSNFAHDLKTSIARLRLQAEILVESMQEKTGSEEKARMDRLLRDLRQLYLQLENSLLVSQLSERLLNERINLLELVEALRMEFEGLTIECLNGAELAADSRALRSIFRNLLQNSVHHGNASKVSISVLETSAGNLTLDVLDNGRGLQRTDLHLGQSLLPVKKNDSNGVGLFLVRRLIDKMNGKLEFYTPASGGFGARIRLNGRRQTDSSKV